MIDTTGRRRNEDSSDDIRDPSGIVAAPYDEDFEVRGKKNGRGNKRRASRNDQIQAANAILSLYGKYGSQASQEKPIDFYADNPLN